MTVGLKDEAMVLSEKQLLKKIKHLRSRKKSLDAKLERIYTRSRRIDHQIAVLQEFCSHELVQTRSDGTKGCVKCGWEEDPYLPF